MNWRDYWNQDTPLYVSERHKLLHYRQVAKDCLDLIVSPRSVVLDYGCGEALFADKVAQGCAKLYLCDGAPLVRQKLAERFGTQERIHVLSPEEMDALPDGSVDLILVNSLLQYLPVEDLRRLLKVWRAKLKDDGRLVLADVLPPDLSPWTDAKALLSFAAQGGFLRSALLGLVRTAFSDYRKIREEVGLTDHSEGELADLVGAAGFSLERQPRNLGHNQARMTFVARPR